MKILTFILLLGSIFWSRAQEGPISTYKKRVLEAAEVNLLMSYYQQDGEHAAVTGGEGTEALKDVSSSIVVSLPLNADDVLTVDVGISAYSSASTSNINPLDGSNTVVSPFSASSGASRNDVLVYTNPSYEHSSDDRNSIWRAQASFSNEFDYFSLGFGGGYTRLFNEKNTEISANAQVFLDHWNPQIPIELRDGFYDDRITGDGTYNPVFAEFSTDKRNSYAISLSFSQILGRKWQASFLMDLVLQDGLLGTPFQRIYFGDVNDFYIDEFQLADDVERLPDSRFKIPLGIRMNYYLNDFFIFRGYYRFYRDDWGINANTVSLEVPIKLSDSFTVYPIYRFYTQTASDYFYKTEDALSTYIFYTSDYDLSNFHAHQYGLGLQYKDVFADARLFLFGLKALDLRLNRYNRSDGLDAFIVTFGATFVGE
ncbi:DUF3570 domain-containing protein [Flavobacteriaceae bacterium F89]|uniref:DUF3570 domain-containing protein n=1 Tax=Cerina litoralis TaxID=2874477 RepID=A0AAE3JQI1_9FLAO|nr:DUF3570 domain-containing protein [Cerina litoralis]MCG2462121.1 DUF3570 domain-containing protein [Cerina litoralis]